MAANQSQSDAHGEAPAPLNAELANELWHELRLAGEITFEQEKDILWKHHHRLAKLSGKLERKLRALQPSAPASAAYEAANPLGGPAKVFEAIASRIRAGEDYYEVLRDYDLQHVSPATASTKDEEIERLRVQLAGCGVAAMGGTSEDQVVERGAYGWSQSYDDVLSLRRKYDALISETPASETAKPTSEQQQRGVEAYQQWRANSDNRESSAYGGNLHDLARRMYESMR